MGSEQEKSKIELAVFNEFVAKARVPVVPGTICKPGTPSEPDIFCTLSNGEQVAYELVEICSSDIAATISKIRKGGDFVAGSTSAFVNVVVASAHAACFKSSGRIRSGFNQT